MPELPGNKLEIDRPPAPRETTGLGSEKHLLRLPKLRNARKWRFFFQSGWTIGGAGKGSTGQPLVRQKGVMCPRGLWCSGARESGQAGGLPERPAAVAGRSRLLRAPGMKPAPRPRWETPQTRLISMHSAPCGLDPFTALCWHSAPIVMFFFCASEWHQRTQAKEERE